MVGDLTPPKSLHLCLLLRELMPTTLQFMSKIETSYLYNELLGHIYFFLLSCNSFLNVAKWAGGHNKRHV